MNYLEWAKEKFKDDIFATQAAGIEIEATDIGYARCSMKIMPHHKNAANAVMGGAIFTLADFAFAIAANAGSPLTVSQTSQITFLGGAKGDTLYAEAKSVKSGKRTCFFIIEVSDNLGTQVASVSTSGFRV